MAQALAYYDSIVFRDKACWIGCPIDTSDGVSHSVNVHQGDREVSQVSLYDSPNEPLGLFGSQFNFYFISTLKQVDSERDIRLSFNRICWSGWCWIHGSICYGLSIWCRK